MKRLIAVCAALLLALGMAAGGAADIPAKPYTFAYAYDFTGKVLSADSVAEIARYGAALERRGDFLYCQGRQLCAAGSQRAHEHFKRDDDGQGLRRGALTEAICKTLERRDAGHQDRWDRVWAG